jgi:autotransporter-associated beta strand protein
VALGSGRLEASFVNLTLGNYSSSLGPDLSGSLAFSSGNLTGTTINMARKAGSSRQIVNATINQSGGTTTVQNLFMGIGGTDLARLRPSYNLTGGTLAAWTISAGNGTFHSTESNRTITISGNAALRNRLNGNLTITGLNSTAGGRLNLVAGGPASFIADTSRLFTIGSNTTLSGSGNISKSGAGTLILSSNLPNPYNGTLSSTQGSLVLNTSLANATVALAGGNMSGDGSIGHLLLGSGTLNPVGTTANMAIGNLTWNSTATIRCGLSGANGSERLVISGNFARGNGTTFTFNFNGGGSASGSYIVATFASHSFSQSDFQASNLAPGLSGAFVLENNTLIFNVSGSTPQTIGDFTTITDKVATDAPFSITPPVASSGLPVVLSIQSGNATISGNLVTLTGTGPVVVAANQPGDATFTAAPEVTTTFNVSKASQTINPFSTISNRRIGDGPFDITPPSSNSGLPVVVTRSSGPVTLIGNTITPTGTGVVVLAANQSGDAIYSAATEVTTSFTILGDQVTLIVVPPSAGDGSITEGFAGETLRDPGVSYSITATPASGMRLARWLRNGSQISTSATYTFTMNANTTLQPVFTPNFGTLQGTFNGLVGDGGIGTGSAQDMADFPLNNGYISLVVASNGNFTGNLTLENQVDSFTGGFSENKSTTFLISRAGKSAATAELNLSTASPGEISGNITVESVSTPFTAKKGSYISANSSTFTLILPSPAGQPLGHSYGTLIFSASSTSGTGSFAGRLSTNQTFSASARIVDSGSGSWVLPIYSRITAGGNATAILTGEVVVPKSPAPGSPTATAALEWLHFSSPGSAFVPDGFLVALDGLGTQLATGNQTSMLTGNSSSGNFTLILDPQATLLASPISQAGVWTVNNTTSLIAPVSNSLIFGTVSRTGPTIGTYSGTFSRPASPSNITTRYYGNVLTTPVTLPNGGTQLRGAGYFMTGNASVPVILTSP